MKAVIFISSLLIANFSFAQVAYDATTGGGTNTSFDHTPVGTPRAIVFSNATSGNTETITAVTYGGVAMSHVTSSPLVHSTGEVGTINVWFLGHSIPTGTQTVSITYSGTQTGRSSRVYSLTAGDNTVIHAATSINSAALSNPSGTLSLNGRTCWVGLTGFSGQDATSGTTQLSGWTSSAETDFGSQIGMHYRYNTVGTTDVTVGWTQTSEDAAMIAFAVTQVQRKQIQLQ